VKGGKQEKKRKKSKNHKNKYQGMKRKKVRIKNECEIENPNLAG
jgi:hypothetical protein